MIRKILIVILILVLGAGGYIAYNFYLRTGHYEKMVGEKLQKVIHDGSQGLYKFTYERISIDPFSVSISIDGARIQVDSNILRSDLKRSLSTIVEISIDNVKLHHASPQAFLKEREIKINSISVNNCTAIIHRGRSSQVEVEEDSIRESLYQLLSKDISSITLDSVIMKNTRLIMPGRGKLKKISIENFDMKLYSILLDSQSVHDKNRFLLARSAVATLEQFSLPEAGLYSFEAHDMIVRIPEGTGSAGKIKLDPRVSESKFAQIAKMDKKLVKMGIASLTFDGFDYKRLLASQEVILNNFNVSGLEIDVYHPKFLKKDTTNLVGDYPHQIMQNLDLPVRIKTLKVQNSKITYRQQNPKSGKLGKLVISNISGRFVNVSNLKNSDRYMYFYGKGVVHGKIPLQTTWTFDMKKKGGYFNVKGSAGGFEGTVLNTVLEPMGMVRLEDGKVNGISFEIHGSDKQCNGTVSFMYENLKVQVLEKDDEKIRKKKFQSAIANSVIINNHNRPGDKIPDKVQARFDRDINRNIFHLVWNTILDGMKKTMQHGKPAARLLKGLKKSDQS